MPQKDTLAIAQRQALNIHLSIALMDRPLEIWGLVDDLLQTLTGYPKFTEDQDFREPPPPPPATLIVSLLEKHRGGLTRHRICKETSLETETAQQAIDELLDEQLIHVPKKQGSKTYILVQ